jgi:hypothetical protein
VVTGRHVFAGEDDERETFSASSDKRPQFLLPWQILAYLPLARPHAEMHAQPFGKSRLTKYLYQTKNGNCIRRFQLYDMSGMRKVCKYVEILQSEYIRC